MKKHRSKFFLLILFIAIAFNMTLFTNSLFFKFNVDTLHEKLINFDNLRMSGPEINITTPENKTYYGSMSGYYPATYGFESEDVGTSGTDIGFVDTVQLNAEIISSLGDHKKVLEINDDSLSIACHAYNNLTSAQSNGTVEYWIASSNCTALNKFTPFDDDMVGFRFAIYADKFQFRDSTDWHDIIGAPTPQDNSWYHIRIDFEASTGGYEGLTQYTWRVYIDGIEYGDYSFENNQASFNKIAFKTGTVSSPIIYIDAIGYSWDPKYNIGDNLQEGLLLSFENSTTLDWIGYSLDGQVNNTIVGNTTLPFPSNDGVHSIQVFGNNSIGTMYQSDMRYFTTELINIVTPENKTYTEPMSGYYPATYGFENDKIGDDPTDWSIAEDGGTVKVISELDNHKSLVEFHDTSGTEDVWIAKNLTSQESGTLEVWVRITDTTDSIVFVLFDVYGGNTAFQTQIRYDILRTSDAGWQTLVDPALDNTWYHIRWDFNCVDDTYDIYIDNELKRSNCVFGVNIASIGHILIRTSNEPIDYYAYIDAFGYTGDSDYDIGDNLQEGLLLNFENNTKFNWFGYSLDNRPSRTILGNTTFPFPTNDGVHTIQVFGNNSIGTMYESVIMYFTIDTTTPISIISFTPYNGTNEVNKSTTFTLTANDGVGSGVSVIRYKINDSSWIDYSAPFNLSSYDYGYYMIYYYSIDVAGHIEPENSLLVKLVEIPDDPGEPGDSTISGYIAPLLIASICIVITSIIRKKLKSK